MRRGACFGATMNVADMQKRKEKQGRSRRDSQSPSEFGVMLGGTTTKGRRRVRDRAAPRGTSSGSFPSPGHFESEPTSRTLLAQNGRLEQACGWFDWLDEDGEISDRFTRLSPEHVRHEIIRRTELTISAGVLLYLYSTKEHDAKKKTDKDLERKWKVHELRAANMKYELELRKYQRRVEALEGALNSAQGAALPEEVRKRIAHVLKEGLGADCEAE